MPDVTFDIKATMPQHWLPHFLGFLNMVETCGSIGASRVLAIYADGDGDFHPTFDWGNIDGLSLAEPAEGALDSDASVTADMIWDAG